jgi:lactam utilization protein B
MAEIQQSTNSADLTQRFIELVMMNAQQAALCLGQMAHPSTGKAEVNLDAARMFIDHLEIIKEKTRGNLNKDEEKILTSVLSELQLAFVQVAQGGEVTGHVHDENCDHGDHHQAIAHEEVSATPESPKQEATPTEEGEGKKKFTKSYGA